MVVSRSLIGYSPRHMQILASLTLPGLLLAGRWTHLPRPDVRIITLHLVFGPDRTPAVSPVQLPIMITPTTLHWRYYLFGLDKCMVLYHNGHAAVVFWLSDFLQMFCFKSPNLVTLKNLTATASGSAFNYPSTKRLHGLFPI